MLDDEDIFYDDEYFENPYEQRIWESFEDFEKLDMSEQAEWCRQMETLLREEQEFLARQDEEALGQISTGGRDVDSGYDDVYRKNAAHLQEYIETNESSEAKKNPLLNEVRKLLWMDKGYFEARSQGTTRGEKNKKGMEYLAKRAAGLDDGYYEARARGGDKRAKRNWNGLWYLFKRHMGIAEIERKWREANNTDCGKFKKFWLKVAAVTEGVLRNDIIKMVTGKFRKPMKAVSAFIRTGRLVEHLEETGGHVKCDDIVSLCKTYKDMGIPIPEDLLAAYDKAKKGEKLIDAASDIKRGIEKETAYRNRKKSAEAAAGRDNSTLANDMMADAAKTDYNGNSAQNTLMEDMMADVSAVRNREDRRAEAEMSVAASVGRENVQNGKSPATPYVRQVQIR